jgi:hypothetical protein
MAGFTIADLRRRGRCGAATASLPYVPFPVDALPSSLAAFVRQAAEALGCDVSYLALPVLAVAASLIANSRSMRLKRDWIEPSGLWTAIIGDSGTLKSPAQRLAVAPVYAMQRELLAAYAKRKSVRTLANPCGHPRRGEHVDRTTAF